MTPVADPGRDTFAVDDQWRLYVNPERLAEWSILESAGVLLHEVGHLIRDHSGRARTLNVGPGETAFLWNLAADAEINDDLLAAKVKLPARPVTPKSLKLPRGRVAEFYYSKLVASPPKLKIPDCGSGCHGQEEESHSVAAGLPRGLSVVEGVLLRQRVAEQILLEASAGVTAGDVPGGWVRWAEAHLRPQLDWRQILSGVIRSGVAAVVGNVDYSYARPSRRRVPKVVLPAMNRPVPRVAIIVDTSGSVNEAMLQAAWTEVHGCLRRLGARRDLLSVYAADVDLHRLRGVPRKQAALAGGGGTDMAAAISRVLRMSEKPDLVVVITDGLTPWPAQRPTRPVIVARLQSGFSGHAQPPPSWAKVVDIPETEMAGMH